MIEKLRKLPNSHALLFITAKVLGGIGIGVLLATWMDTWYWWIFVVIACVIAIPVACRLFSK
jgi:hypothetical protein